MRGLTIKQSVGATQFRRSTKHFKVREGNGSWKCMPASKKWEQFFDKSSLS